MLRRIGAALAGALVAGMVAGAAARLMMVLVALAADGHSRFTWSGSVGILTVFVLVMMPGALLSAFVRRRGRWLLLAAGAAFLLVPALAIAGEEIGATRHFTALTWVLVGLPSLGVFAAIAALPLITLRMVDRTLSRPRAGRVGTDPAGGPHPSPVPPG